MTKLAELQPHWMVPNNWAGTAKFASGVTFLCPHCVEFQCPTCGHVRSRQRIAVQFWPPIDPEGYVEKYEWQRWPDHKVTRRSGETFEDLSLIEYIEIEGHGRFAVTEGEVITQEVITT